MSDNKQLVYSGKSETFSWSEDWSTTR